MASVEIHNELGSSATRDGHLIIKNGLPISGSLQIVADEFNTSSTLQLSTLSAKVDSDFYVSGDVGIGTDTPSVALEIVSSTNPEIIIDNGGGTSPSPKLTFFRQAGVSADITYDVSSKVLFINNNFTGAGSDIVFRTNGSSEAMRLLDNGTLTLLGNKLTYFTPNIQSGGAVTINNANEDDFCGGVYRVTGAVTITIDDTVSEGFTLTIIQLDANQCTVATTGTITLRNRLSHTGSAGQWATISVIRMSNDLVLSGDTA